MDQKTGAPPRKILGKPAAHANRLLGAFEPEAHARIDPHIQPVALRLGDVICEAGGHLEHVYFPIGSVLSLLTVLANGAAVETANIGNEGAFGLFAAMYSRTSFNLCLVQLEGGLVRVPIEVVRGEFERSEHVRNLLVSYSETLLAQVQQTAACNSMHTIEQRLCRWLLMMHDRAGRESLTYTHEFLAHMLGADRKSVTLAAQAMQAAGLIGYRRGTIQIIDRPGLEKRACECYAIVQARFNAFLTPPAHAVQDHIGGRRPPR
ncbi:MAG: Crp/Fnr family transcriptional regulator [Methylocella sp.]